MFGGEAFATSSADGSIRLWHLDLGQDDTSKASLVYSSMENVHAHNVYSKDILGVLYIGLTPPLLGDSTCDIFLILSILALQFSLM